MSLSGLRATVVLALFTVYALVLIGLFIPARRLGLTRFANWLYLRFHRGMLAVFRIRVNVKGTPSAARPLLIASNHSSWVDIFVLSSVMPIAFIAKREVADWPIAGFLARLQRSVFVDRERRGAAKSSAEEIAARLASGDAMVLFPEGTTSDGNGVLPFRSALFGAARAAIGTAETVTVQPVAIVYTDLQAIPLGREERPLVAWIGDEDLIPHVKRLLTAGALDISVIFGAPIAFTADGDRKRIAAAAEAAVRKLHNEELLRRN